MKGFRELRRVYLSGPIRGIVDHRDVFAAVAERIVANYDVAVTIPQEIEPWDHEGICPADHLTPQGSVHSESCILRGDIYEMLGLDGVVFLPGWEQSVGARLEFQVAAACGMPLFYWDALGLVLRNEKGLLEG